MKAVNDTTFESEVLNESGIVLVDFWAEWCGPCRQMLPVVEEAEKELTDVKFCKVNVDEAPETPSKFGIRGIPTLIAFKDGKQVATKTGAMPKSKLVEWLQSL
jgi:thioredoxin 1